MKTQPQNNITNTPNRQNYHSVCFYAEQECWFSYYIYNFIFISICRDTSAPQYEILLTKATQQCCLHSASSTSAVAWLWVVPACYLSSSNLFTLPGPTRSLSIWQVLCPSHCHRTANYAGFCLDQMCVLMSLHSWYLVPCWHAVDQTP